MEEEAFDIGFHEDVQLGGMLFTPNCHSCGEVKDFLQVLFLSRCQ